MGKSHLLLHTGFCKKDSTYKEKVFSVANSRKFSILSVDISWILREINFGDSRSAKPPIVTHLKAQL